MKTNNSHPTLPHGRQSGGLILNIGIGIVIGLLAALLAVFLVMRGGPFKDHANTNTIAPQTGQAADPNAPLYGAPPQTLDPNANKAAGPSSGEGVGVLTGKGGITDPDASKSATKETAKPVATPAADPVAAIIQNTPSGNKPQPEATTPNKPKANDAPTTKPAAASTQSAKPIVAANSSTNAKPAVKPAATSIPKEVKPATAP